MATSRAGRVPRIADDPQHQKALGEAHYAFTVTTRCQQRCPCCFEGSHDGQDMPLEEVRQHLEAAAATVPVVVFMGAETTLHRDFVAIIEMARSLGLRTFVSSNLLRFADDAFLRRCIVAGLCNFEFSFHYPDAEVFAELTGTASHHFDRLLRAMENVGRACEERNADPQEDRVFMAGPNLVVSARNVDSLPAVVAHVARHLGPSFRQVTVKRLIASKMSGARLEQSWVPAGEVIRRNLVGLLDSWDYPRTFVLLRDFPLCIAPGYEHLHADLLYHAGRAHVVQNFGKLPEFQPMYLYGAQPLASPARECRSCSLLDLCRVLTRGAAVERCPELAPIPSQREPLEVLADLGLGEEVSRSFLDRIKAASSPTAEVAEESAAGPTPPHRAPRAEALLGAALARYPGKARAQLEQVFRNGAAPTAALRIRLRVGGDLIDLDLEPMRPGALCFASTRRFMISHASASLPDEDVGALVKWILRVCDRHL